MSKYQQNNLLTYNLGQLGILNIWYGINVICYLRIKAGLLVYWLDECNTGYIWLI